MSLNQHTAEVRKLTAAELGRGFSEKQKQAEEAQIRQLGAKEAMQAAAKNMAELIGQIRNAWKDNGVIEGFTKEESAKLTAEVQKAIVQGQIAWVQRCVGTLDALVINCDQAIIMAGGKIKAFKEAEEQARAVFEQEAAKMEAFKRAIEDGTLVKGEDGEYVLAPGQDQENNSVVGVHPGLTEKQKRLAEERAEKEAAEAKEPEEPNEPEAPDRPKRLRPKKTPAKKPRKAATKGSRKKK